MSEQHRSFEGLKHLTNEGFEYWSARELAPLLEYSAWRNFENVINKAKSACALSSHEVSDHFVEANKMVPIGSGSQRELDDIHLSRYACYLVVQNGDPSKPVIAAGQTYFAVQTRRQEIADDASFQRLKEDQKRLLLRNELREHNKQLVETAQLAGVQTGLDFAIFQNHGYQGLYGGLDQKAIHQRKGLKKSHKILDHMGSTELAANLFRATQAEEKLRRDQIQGKHQANQVHFEVGSKVRETIAELGGTMPEDLPTPEHSIKHVESSIQRLKSTKKEE
ncbi:MULTISPECIES: DNA damage-inducible protein D [Pseudomonas]|uniref:DNA-damage-inducible protein D n=1 Tax=Pseudomonas hunanensis TaxID=1247546 RepID=A0ACC6JWY7_9PSED|nr:MULTISPECIES: DNA damage-inducible protein D [Pseudomonas]MBP2259627.1 DNA-damage-inducible protein D [Pseudomonas sp. BP8]MDR6710712.1 DNA-damage-inducible protein D [Pseudomonas hunanensis]HDS1733643.1 DNA damage-inducible protein D [Pseudomonas putida]